MCRFVENPGETPPPVATPPLGFGGVFAECALSSMLCKSGFKPKHNNLNLKKRPPVTRRVEFYFFSVTRGGQAAQGEIGEIALVLAINRGCVVKYVSQKRNESNDDSQEYNIFVTFIIKFKCTSIVDQLITASNGSHVCSERSFFFPCCFAATQLARQVHQERTQVVCSHKEARKRLARRLSRNGHWAHVGSGLRNWNGYYY